MNAAVRFIAALFVGLSALVVEANSTQELFSWFYIDPDGTYVEHLNGRITPDPGGSIDSDKPDTYVDFTAHPPLNSGLKVQHWIMARDMPSEDVEERDPTEVKMLSSYSDTLSVSWNVNRYFDTGYVYVGVRFYYITNSVVFNPGANGVSGSTASILNQCYTNSYALTANGFSRTGYAFANWTNDAGVVHSDGETVSGSILGVTNNMQTVDLYAVWSPNTNDVSYALDGGSYGSSHPSSATYDVPFEVSDPTRTGYTFNGWKVTGGLATGTAKYGSDGESWSSVSSDSTLCKGANGSTWFKNLNPANGAAVALTAQWMPKTTTVRFNNYGATSGPTKETYTYGETLYSVTVPKWDGGGVRVFRGYYTEVGGKGECFWNAEGQPVPAGRTWDVVDATLELHAYYIENDCFITYKANGGTGADFSSVFTNGVPVVLSDGKAFSWPGHDLLGWNESSSADSPKYVLGQSVEFYGKTAVDLYAIWQDFYYVAFDGNGATNETPMAVQKFAFGESKALSANEYGKVGYEFSGWATNGAAAAVQDISYADQQVVNNLAKSAGETNTLFAAWRPISYVTAFDASEHSSAVIAPSNCI